MFACTRKYTNLLVEVKNMNYANDLDWLESLMRHICTAVVKSKGCMKESSDQVGVYFTAKEKHMLEKVFRIYDSLSEFACSRDADNMAHSFTEQDLQCLFTNMDGIRTCFHQTDTKYLVSELLDTPTQCVYLQRYESCLLAYLEQCSEIRAINKVKEIFKRVRNEAECQPSKGGTSKLLVFSSLEWLVVGLLLLNRP